MADNTVGPAARFGLDPQLASILQATIAELGW